MKRLIGPLLVVIVFSALPILPQQAGAQSAAMCMGELVTIDMRTGASGIGTGGPDVIRGTTGDDVIDGRGGDDVICGGAGNDNILGGPGNDILRGHVGNDLLDGGAGDDDLAGGSGSDVLEARAGADILRGGGGADVLNGSGGAEVLSGGAGDDEIMGGADDDVLRGGGGADILNGAGGDDILHGGSGDDEIIGGLDDDVLRGGAGDDVLRGAAGDDRLDGGTDFDICIGNSGVDTTTACEATSEVPTGRFETLPVGATLPSGAACAAMIRPATEIRPENNVANANRGSRANANNRGDWSEFDRVDGDFAGTTDEIIQWAACKWGIDEDIVRAQVIKESYWYQSANGDNGESWGLGQVRDTAHQSAFEFSLNARNSSAYNLDYTYGNWRACFEGILTWLNNVERNGVYAAGDAWGCLGVWFSGRWYVNNDAYLNQPGDSVRFHYENRTWETQAFING